MPSTLPSLDNHQVRLAARLVGLPTPADWQFTGGPVAEPADGGVGVQVQALSNPPMRGWMNAGQRYIKGSVVLDDTARFPPAITEMAGYLNGGRMKSQQGVAEAGVAAFPDTLNKLFSGENFGKLVLRLV